MKLSISSKILDELQQAAIVGQPNEICGLLLGNKNMIEGYQRANNIADNPKIHFEIDPTILIAAERSMREGGPEIVGYYHSHPKGRIKPSVTDANSAAPDGRIWIILNGADCAAWKAVADGEIYDRFTPITLDCR